MANVDPTHVNALYYQVRALIQAGQMDEAADGLRRLLQELPDFAQGHFELGWLLQQAHRDADAVEAFDRALSLDASAAAWHAARGLSLFRLERFPEAEASLRRALRHDEACGEALYNLGELLSRLGRRDEAITCYRGALAVGADTSASVSLAHLLEVGLCLAEAEEVVMEGLRHDPLHPTLTSILASVLRGQGRLEDALDILRSAETRTPSNLVVLGTLVEILVEAGDHEEALATAERLFQSQPGAAAQAILGWAQLETGQPVRALETLDSALAAAEGEEDITRANLRGVRAAALAAVGRQAEAEAILGELERDWPQVIVEKRDPAGSCREERPSPDRPQGDPETDDTSR